MLMRFLSRYGIAGMLAVSVLLQAQSKPRSIHSNGNPILADGSYYSADPAPIAVGDTLYILAGRDEAPADVNDFIMNEWQIFATKDPAGGDWLHYPAIAKPEEIFQWAAPGRAYAGQIVQGADKRFYLYAPVAQAHTEEEDPFGVGVAVSDSPLGPWKDAHPSGPIVSHKTPEAHHTQNIDPTILIDNDGRIYMYWGTFGQLLGTELKSDMVTLTGPIVHVTSLKGFFEAPWIFRRGQTYYMSYAGNSAGPQSECTPAIYHACLAYGTSDSPLGPWTYRGVLLDPVSSTTSHEGILEFKGQWYLIYHTADAKDGGHFRRSVAIDRLYWDDSTTPSSIRKVVSTRAPQPAREANRNIAPAAFATASNEPIALQYWIKALNDEKAPANPLPPEMWGSWKPRDIPTQVWLQYRWKDPVEMNAARIFFWNDQPAGAKEGVAPPAQWHLEYLSGRTWLPVPHASTYGIDPGKFQEVRFDTIRTRCLRAVLDASGDSTQHAGIAVEEWEVLAPGAVQLPSKADAATQECTE